MVNCVIVPDRIANSPYPYSIQPSNIYLFNDSSLIEGEMILPLQITQGWLSRVSSDEVIYRQTDPQSVISPFEAMVQTWLPSASLKASITGYDVWLNEISKLSGISINSAYQNDLTKLLMYFKHLFTGFVLCDCATDSVNVGISAAAMFDHPVLAVCNTTNSMNLMKSLDLNMLLDVRQRTLEWIVNNYYSYFNNRMLTIQAPSKYTNLADYSVFGKALTCYDAVVTSNDTCYMIESKMDGKQFPVFGWSSEFEIVSTAASKSGFVHASDWAMDMAVLTNIAIPSFTQKKITQQTTTNRHKVAFVFSDGDNIQWALSVFATDTKWFGSNQRGSAHVGWTVSPALAEVSPVTLKYLYDQAQVTGSGSDYFVAAPSGLGYTYPDKYESTSSLNEYVVLMSDMLKKADLRLVNVIGATTDPKDSMESYLASDQIDAVFYYPYSDYSGLHGNITWVGNKPIIGGRWNLWYPGFETPTTLAKKLNQMSTDPTTSDGYSLIPVGFFINLI